MTRTRSSRRGNPAPAPVDPGTETEHEENDENESLSDASGAASQDEGSQLTRTRSQTPTGSDAESEYSSSAVDAQREVLIEQRLELLQMSQRARNRMLREFQALYQQGRVHAGTVLDCNEDGDDSIVDKPAAILEDPPRLTPEVDFIHTEWDAGPLSPLVATPQSESAEPVPISVEVVAPGAATPAADPGDATSTYADASERMDIDEEREAEEESSGDPEVVDKSEDTTDQAVSATVTDRESVASATPRGTESDLQVDLDSHRPATEASERPSPAPSRSPDTEAPTDEAEVEAAATMSAPEDVLDVEPAVTTEQVDQTMEVDDVVVDQSLGVAPADVQPRPPPRPRIAIDPSVLLLPPRSPGGSLITFAPPSPRRLLLNAPQPLASNMILEGMDVASPSDNATLIDQGPIPESEFSRKLPLPPLASLPSSFNILTKPAKLHRRREKERKESLAAVGGGPVPGAASSDLKATLAPPSVQEYLPLGMNRWAATIRANPVHKLIKKAPKVLLTSDWRVAHDELMFMRGMEKIDKLKQDSMWSFRQPKRQKNPTNVKVHWDYVLDEMKWMRTDFREERKWKLAMAHQLAHAVVEWHETPAEQRHVLCCKFPRLPFIPYNDDELEQQAEDTVMAEADAAQDDPPVVVQGWQPPPAGTPDLLGPPSPERVLGLEAHIASGSMFVDDDLDPLLLLPAKTEEADFDIGSLPVSTLGLADLVPANGLPQEKIEDQKPVDMGEPVGVSALRPGSQNPLVGNITVGKLGPYPQYRDPILNLDDDELWLDLEKLAVSSTSTGTTADTPAPQTPAAQTSPNAFVKPFIATLPEIFPELEVYDAFSSVGPDGTIAYSLVEAYHDRPGDKRSEEVQLGRLTSTSIYMDVRPTLLSALNPAEKFKNGVWTDLEDTVVLPSLVPDEAVAKAPANRSELFGSHRPDSLRPLGRSVPSSIPVHPQSRANELYWTAAEDDLLKALVDKFHGNWSLIADWFNSSRTTIAEPSDARTPWDCCERWQRLYGAAEEHARSPSPPPLAEPPMPGVKLLKRTAATALSNPPAEPLKRRRTMQFTSTMSTVRKKRADTTKANATAIKRAMTSSTHETHLKISKASYSVADMIALKVNKDREELLRQQAIRAAANVPAALAQQMPNMNAQAQRMVLGQGQKIAMGDRNGAPQQYPPQVIAALRAQAQAQAQAVASANAAGGTPLTDQQLQALRMNMPNIPGMPNLSNINLQGMPPERVQQLHQQLQRQTALRIAQQQAQATMAAQAAVQQVVQQQNGGTAAAPGPSAAATNGTHSSPPMAQAQPALRPGSARPPSAAPHMDAASIQMAQQQAVHAMMQNYSNEEQIRQRVNLQNMIGANGVSSPAAPNGAPAAGHR